MVHDLGAALLCRRHVERIQTNNAVERVANRLADGTAAKGIERNGDFASGLADPSSYAEMKAPPKRGSINRKLNWWSLDFIVSSADDSRHAISRWQGQNLSARHQPDAAPSGLH